MIAILSFISTCAAAWFLGQNELVRIIPGKLFPWVWLLPMLASVVIIMGVFEAFRRKCCNRMENELGQLKINHTDVPHLLSGFQHMQGKTGVSYAVRQYYMLRLYLRGIVRFAWQKEWRGCLAVDEECLEKVKADGGRHSEVAAAIIHNIRTTPNCTLREALQYGEAFLHEPQEHEVFQNVEAQIKKGTKPLQIIYAVAMGIGWGILLAKLTMGIQYNKSVGYLIGRCFIGLPFTLVMIGVLPMMMTKAIKDKLLVGEAQIANLLKRHQARISPELLAKADETLLTEQERHRILNAYFVDTMAFMGMALKLGEKTFLHHMVQTLREVQEETREKLRKAAVEERLKRISEVDSSSSSCGSCSSCGGCGGCGGCGD